MPDVTMPPATALSAHLGPSQSSVKCPAPRHSPNPHPRKNRHHLHLNSPLLQSTRQALLQLTRRLRTPRRTHRRLRTLA